MVCSHYDTVIIIRFWCVLLRSLPFYFEVLVGRRKSLEKLETLIWRLKYVVVAMVVS
jgi:polyferredoxin